MSGQVEHTGAAGALALAFEPSRRFEAPEGHSIGEIVAGLVPDEATLQLGIGALPNAVLGKLSDKRDLGIHSELFSDGVMKMVEKGVITNAAKSLHPGKIIAGFAFGSQRFYQFMHDNAMVELRPTDYVNDPFVIAQNSKMVAINSAIEIDLSGQVCADSIGLRIYSGIGGQVDFTVDLGAAIPHMKSGKVRLLGVPTSARSPLFPDVPTLVEQGTNVELSWISGIYAPAGTPRPIVERLNAEITRAMQSPEAKKHLDAMAAVALPPMTAEQLELARTLSMVMPSVKP